MPDTDTEDRDEQALEERVRQAEIRISAQMTVMIGTHIRAVAFTGVLFAVLAALASVSQNYPSESPFGFASFITLAPLAVSVILCGLSTAFSKVELPGEMHSKCTHNGKSEILSCALSQYFWTYRRNAAQMAAALWVLRAGLLFAAMAIGLGGWKLYEGLAETRARMLEVEEAGSGSPVPPSTIGKGNVVRPSTTPEQTFSLTECRHVVERETRLIFCKDDRGFPIELQVYRTRPSGADITR
jgi:hypothetical protein